jgi:hypothetical protein
MNNQRKAAALKKYGPEMAGGKTAADLKTALEADDKKYKPEEIDEILEALLAGDTGETPPAKGKEKAKAPQGVNADFDEWDVDPKMVQKKIPGPGNRTYQEFSHYELVRKLRTTRISQDRADILNTQAQNTRRLLTAYGSNKAGDKVYPESQD